MALYRTYRPQTFADVVGQDHIVTTLENAAKQGKLAHAFLFAGSRGTGKTSVARILAKVLMTKSIADESVQSKIIEAVEDGSIVDLIEIDGASNRGIDDIRDLIEKIQFSPVVAGAKVYIIDEVHMLTKEAFNALLKTLEEPPEYAYFILATTELNKIPATIQSRCQCFPFRHIREEDIVRRLQFIADQERMTVDREALRAIAHHVQGGMRDAISLLDQMRSLEKVTVADVEQRIGGGSLEQVEALLLAMQTQDATAVLETVRKVEEAGVALDVFLRDVLGSVRESLHASITANESTAEHLHILHVLLQAIRDVRSAPVPGLVAEAALLSLCMPASEQSSEKKRPILSTPKKEQPEKKPTVEKKAEAPKAQAEEPVKEPEPPKATTLEAPDLTMESLRLAWPEIVQQATPPMVKMSLKDGRIESIDDKKVTVRFSSTFHRDKVASTDASRTVESIMEKIFKQKLRLECTIEDQSPTMTTDEETVDLAEAASEIF